MKREKNRLYGICTLITSFLIIEITRINLPLMITNFFYGFAFIITVGILIKCIIKVMKSNQN